MLRDRVVVAIIWSTIEESVLEIMVWRLEDGEIRPTFYIVGGFSPVG